MNESSAPTGSNLNPPPNFEESMKSSMLRVYILVGAICLCITAGMVVAFVIYRRRKSVEYGKKYLWANTQLSKECKSNFKCTTADQLLKVTNEIMKQETAAESYLFRNIGNHKEDQNAETNQETREIKTCWDPTVACLKRTQIQLKLPCKKERVPLNVNEMNDYFMNFLYIGQVPSEREFEAFWQAIDELNINVVVWIDNGLEENCHMPIKQLNIPEKYGAYSVRNVSIICLLNMCKAYELEFIRSYKFIEGQARRLIVFQVQNWPCTSGDALAPERLMHVVEHVVVYQKSMCKPNSNSSNILLQCKTGTEQSATFAAIFIGRQMWMSDLEVNVVGIMRYIRNCRHGSFTKSKSPGFQAQIVFSATTFLVKDKLTRPAINDAEGKLNQNQSPKTSIVKPKIQTGSLTTSSKSVK